MSFRFQKRVRIAPGVRLNFSKRGISTSVGPRGASVTAGKRGLYGNAGIPGTGLSYRSKINKKNKRTSNNRDQTSRSPSKNKSEVDQNPIQVIWDDTLQDVRFERSNGHTLSAQEEKLVRKQYKNQLVDIYNEKAAEINQQTERLLDLHKQLFHSDDSLSEMVTSSLDLDIVEPEEGTIFDNLFVSQKNELSFFEKCLLWLPERKKRFTELIREQANSEYQEKFEHYSNEKEAMLEEKEIRQQLTEKVSEGKIEAMEDWVALFLDELDFPLETDVDFQVVSATNAYVDIDLPTLAEVPIKQAKVMKSGKLKIEDKTQRDHREHYALMIGGSALYLASFFFHFFPTLQSVTLSGYNQVIDPSTGHENDQYIYSLKIDRKTLYSLNTKRVHPIAAFDQFQPRLNATKTYIFKEIEPYQN